MASHQSAIPIGSIATDGGTQIRERLCEETVERYTDALKAGANLPPVEVFHDGTDYWLADGFHRLEAHRRAGRESIVARIEHDNLRAAILFACGANASHGLPRSRADRRRSIEVMLSDEEWAQKSDREIARYCRVSHPTVAKVRRELGGKLSTSRRGVDNVPERPEFNPDDVERREVIGTPDSMPVAEASPEPGKPQAEPRPTGNPPEPPPEPSIEVGLCLPEPGDIASGPGWELRFGAWTDVLTDIPKCASVITDPPFSERTHKGQRSSGAHEPGWVGDPKRSRIHYGHITEEDMARIVGHWGPIVGRWLLVFGDHITMAWAAAEIQKLDLYGFAPLPYVKSDAAPRFMADGPASSTEWIKVARPRRKLDRQEKRHRPGHYIGASRHKGKVVVGGKPDWLMDALVSDYSEPGDLIVDPFAGGASTLLAASRFGRNAIGAEVDPTTFAKAVLRLEAA